MQIKWLCLAIALMGCGAAVAQPAPPPFSQAGNSKAMSVSSTSSNIGLPPGGGTIVVDNTGTIDAYVAFDGSNALAVTTTTGFRVPAGLQRQFNLQQGQTFIAAITASSTTTLSLSPGSGVLANGGGGGGSGGGGGTSATFGGAFPGTGTPVGGSDGTLFQPLAVDATTHYLQVDIKAGTIGAGGTSLADEGPYNVGSTPFTPVGGFFQTTATSGPLTNGQGGWAQMTSNRALHINLRTAAGVETGIAAAPLVTTALSSGAITNPTSTLTMTGATTAYTAGQLIASSATAGSVVVPSFAIATSAGGAIIPRLRLSTNDATGTAWGAASIQVDLWSAAPTWTNGDRAAWSPATGTASHLGSYACTMSAEYGDGTYAECSSAVGNAAMPKLASGTSVFWSLKAVTGSGVTGASKVWTLTAEELN